MAKVGLLWSLEGSPKFQPDNVSVFSFGFPPFIRSVLCK